MEPTAPRHKENNMSAINPLLNSALNQIHHWSEPDQNPMKRMFLTRFAQIGCAGIEVALLAIKTMEMGQLIVKNILHSLQDTTSQSFYPGLIVELSGKADEVASLVEGLASTVFFGIIFSPEANFKVHLRLKLAVDNIAEKTEKERAAKLEAELQKAEIIQMRNERYAKLEVEQQAIKDAETEACKVNSQLANLLLHK